MNTVEDMNRKLQKTLDKAKMDLLCEPESVFLTTVLFSLNFSWDDSLNPPTAETNGINLKIHPGFWLSLDHPTRMFVLAHEAWHVAFNHMNIPPGIDSENHNIAADFVINLMLKKANIYVPNEAYCDYKYDGLSTMEVYHLLPPRPPQDQPMTGGLIGADVDPSNDKNQEEKNEIQNQVESVILRANTMNKMQGSKAGKIPSEIELVIDGLLNPKLDWKTILQNYMTDFDKTDYSFKRPNRRFMPEFYLPSLHGENIGNIAVAVDTSVSVEEEEFRSFLSEINDIKERLNPKLTTIIDFDTSIKHVHILGPSESVEDLPFSGRGGTSLSCVFDYFDKNPTKLLIVFSDLECRVIREEPDFPVIWICVNNPHAHVEFGKLIHIETEV